VFTKTGLFRNVSNRSFVLKEKSLSDQKPSDNQVSSLLEDNQGHLPLWNSRALAGFVKAKCPVVCTSNKHNNKVWLVRSLLQAWCYHGFYPTVKIYSSKNNLPQNAPLLINNVRSHTDNLMRS
jgi:hypothetical protein